MPFPRRRTDAAATATRMVPAEDIGKTYKNWIGQHMTVFGKIRTLLLLGLLLITAGVAYARGVDGAEGSANVGGPGKASDVDRTIRIEAREFAFNVKTIRVRPGETVRFVVTNKGTIPHEFVLATHEEHVEHRAMMAKMPDMARNEPNMILLKPGQTKELIWRFGNAAHFEFACDIPGHPEDGMWGTFVYVK